MFLYTVYFVKGAKWQSGNTQVCSFYKVGDGDIDDFVRLLTPESVDCRTPQLLSLLHVICAGQSDGQVKKITHLLEDVCGNDPSKKNGLLSHLSNNGFSAMHIAVYK
ncbi:hypothetical protein NECAME_09181, partial [Necator americanus]